LKLPGNYDPEMNQRGKLPWRAGMVDKNVAVKALRNNTNQQLSTIGLQAVLYSEQLIHYQSLAETAMLNLVDFGGVHRYRIIYSVLP
jgi:hypothetical protein